MEQIIEIMTEELTKVGIKMVTVALVITLIMMAATLVKKWILRKIRECKEKKDLRK